MHTLLIAIILYPATDVNELIAVNLLIRSARVRTTVGQTMMWFIGGLLTAHNITIHLIVCCSSCARFYNSFCIQNLFYFLFSILLISVVFSGTFYISFYHGLCLIYKNIVYTVVYTYNDVYIQLNCIWWVVNCHLSKTIT